MPETLNVFDDLHEGPYATGTLGLRVKYYIGAADCGAEFEGGKMKTNYLRVAPCFAVLMLMTGCGAIAEEAAERALEQGGVEVELDDVEDGEFTINIEGEDGEETTIEIDGEEGTVDFESEDGEGTLQISEDEATIDFESEDGEGSLSIESGLAEGWPDEFPLPDNATVLSSIGFEENGESSFTAIFTGPADSMDEYLDHFRNLGVPIANETDTVAGDSRQVVLVFGAEEAPLGTLLLSVAGDELSGQISLGDFN